MSDTCWDASFDILIKINGGTFRYKRMLSHVTNILQNKTCIFYEYYYRVNNFTGFS